MSQDKQYSICVLLGVWGGKFIKEFLALSLPTLLAPGNIPALAANAKTRFVILTRSIDVSAFELDQQFKKLKEICEVEFVLIEDLISFNNYSTTLTLAYNRVIQSAGEKMLQTHFVFLTSDYIMADGSMEGLLRYIKKGYSGICAGNYQVTAEDIKPYLLKQINPDTGVMQIKPRELVSLSMRYLHPVAMASMFEQNAIHNYNANRFFCRLDSHLLAGRFFLLHMLCIKPETMDYKIGASCDYSFIPEMCPSGNVAIINDSDDYLVIEAQPKGHETSMVNWGGYESHKLISTLANWTTKQHRENARHTIYFHARDITESDKQQIENSFDHFIRPILADLKQYKEKPFYNHPYWIGAMKAFNKHRAILRDSHDHDYLDARINSPSVAERMYHRIYGMPPKFFRWHHRWREYRLIRHFIKNSIASRDVDNIAVFYNSYFNLFMQFCSWFKSTWHIKHHYFIRSLKHTPSKLHELQTNPFDLCFLMVRMEEMGSIKSLLMFVEKMVKKNGTVLVFIPNEKNGYPKVLYDFQGAFSHNINGMINTDFRLVSVDPINNNLTLLGGMLTQRIYNIMKMNKVLGYSLCVLFGLPSVLFCSVWNMIFGSSTFKKTGHCAGIFVTLALDNATGSEHAH